MMTVEKIERVGVLGAGVMGAGIAQLLAQNRLDVRLVSHSIQSSRQGLERIKRNLDGLQARGKLSQQSAEQVFSRVHLAESLVDVDLVIEAVPEVLELKRDVLARMEKTLPAEALIASNTSTLPITLLAAATQRPGRFVGMHFFNPAPVMEGVELVAGRLTAPETLELARQFVRKLGKKPVVAQDFAGFITSRLINLYLNEAALAVMNGNAPQDVDDAMQHCLKMPMGPCALIDLIGVDVVLSCLYTLEEEFGDRFHPAPLLRQMMRAGHLGRKTGRGFYTYN
ncbi:MAG: 3-hydroxyacyl-CoA dehydrogenase family protein [Candidatus Xenobia bacterium]